MSQPTTEEIVEALACLKRIANAMETLAARGASMGKGEFSNALVTCPDCRAMYWDNMPHICSFSSAMGG
jgi:hypothetical protein